ncbi:hypothetical protein LCGC14_2484740 [marine sediment metagenome]|uniref:Uncharacterized protein n=1 Tax=marine sediment metagenome TaxID=412755 RepID=A0A0F9B793_9ZZZZ
MGDASAPAVGERPNTGPGGIGIRVDGVPQGVRSNVNYPTPAGTTPKGPPGLVTTAADDGANNRINVTHRIAGEVELGSVTGFNLLTTSVLDIFTTLGLTLGQVSRIVLIAEDVTVVSVQPQLEAGTGAGPPNNDHVVAVALVLTANDQIQELGPILQGRPAVGAATQFRLRRTVAPTATTYTIGAIVYGTPITP